jgi:hypothetical protein
MEREDSRENDPSVRMEREGTQGKMTCLSGWRERGLKAK